MTRFLITLVNGRLSQSELKNILMKAKIPFKILENNEIFIVLEISKKEELLKLGGIYKIGRIICTNNSLEDLYEKIEKSRILENLEHKQKWNISYYSKNQIDIKTYENMQNFIRTQIKKNTKKSKFIKNNMNSENFIELSVDKEKQTSINILVGYDEKRYYFAENEFSVKSSKFINRDLNRPYQDSKISLSPRTARILVNILGLEKEKIVLDPFCGTGTFLLEALMQGYEIIGIDNRKECVIGTKNNLYWLIKQHKLKNRIKYVKKDNAEVLSSVETSTIDGIVTEPILLPNFKNFPTYTIAEESLKQSKRIYKKGLKSMYRVLKKNGRVSIVTPRIRTRNNEFITFDFRQMIKETKFSLNNNLEEQPFIMNTSNNQKIIREIWLLNKN